jgi:hypothetical protein
MPTTKTTKKPAARASRKPKLLEIAAPEPEGLKILEPTEGPGWVNSTPNEVEYNLLMTAPGGESQECLPLTRREFVMLKRCLAASLGYELRIPTDHCSSDAKDEITQEEIEMVLDLTVAADSFFVNFKKRMAEGVAVQPGKWSVSNDSDDYRENYESNITSWDKNGIRISLTSAENLLPV